jgi:hypothetical protein
MSLNGLYRPLIPSHPTLLKNLKKSKKEKRAKTLSLSLKIKSKKQLPTTNSTGFNNAGHRLKNEVNKQGS